FEFTCGLSFGALVEDFRGRFCRRAREFVGALRLLAGLDGLDYFFGLSALLGLAALLASAAPAVSSAAPAIATIVAPAGARRFGRTRVELRRVPDALLERLERRQNHQPIAAVINLQPQSIQPEAQVDEVADDHAAQIAQAELTGDFIRRFQICLERSRLRIGVLAEFSAVDVDGDDRFGRIDHQRSAAGKRDVAAVNLLDFLLDP